VLKKVKKRRKEIISYTYDPNTNEKTVIVKKKQERRAPENLVDLLIMRKKVLYEREQTTKLWRDAQLD
jgi:hypothetical protein